MMKELKDFEEEIYKCSRCGLCQSVCPVYKVTLNECSVSKAKFTMLNGILKGDLALNERIKKHMDMCIGCNACKDFCPSNIDAREIFTAVKSQYYKENQISFFEKVIDSYLLFKFLLICAKITFAIYRFLRIDKMVQFLYKHLPSRVLLLNSLIKTNTNEPNVKKCLNELSLKRLVNAENESWQTSDFASENRKCCHPALVAGSMKSFYQIPQQVRDDEILEVQKNTKAVYFAGCFNDYLNPSSKNALYKIFNELEIELCEKNFECCGVSYLSCGKTEEFIKLAKTNIELLCDDYDFIMTDCASCNHVLKEYKKYLPSDKTEELSRKTFNILEFLKDKKIIAKQKIKVTAHKPCHEDFDFIDILKNIENVEYIETQDFDKCCGFSGKFALQFSQISTEISKRKAKDFLETQADYIITTCPACKLGVNQGLAQHKKNDRSGSIQVYNLIEFIAQHCSISNV